jgi:hypothetical protein
MDVNEGNLLIATFMGAEPTQAYSATKEQTGILLNYPAHNAPGLYRNYSLGSVKYHSNWDWLMPVVETIEKSYGSSYNFYDALKNAEPTKKLSAGWQTIVDIIKSKT